MNPHDSECSYRRAAAVALLAGALLATTPSAGAASNLESRMEAAAACGPPEVHVDVASLPLLFALNRGQSWPGVAYEAHSIGSAAVFLGRRGGARLRLDAIDGLPARSLRFHFPGALPVVEPAEPTRAETSFLVGDDPSRWLSHLPTYGAVVYRDLYAGVDLRYRGDGQRLMATFTVAPGSDPGRIHWRIASRQPEDLALREGRLSVRLDPKGRRSVAWQAPRAWQMDGSERVPVAAAYRLQGSEVGLRLGRYARSRPLQIEVVLAHSPYFDRYGAAAGADGLTYVTAGTPGSWLGRRRGMRRDVVVARIDAERGEVFGLTLIGGRGDDRGRAIALTPWGETLVAGETFSADFPVVDAVQSTPGGAGDAFVLLLSGDGSNLLRSTYHGGPGSDAARGLALAEDGLYLLGTAGAGFPRARPEAVSFAAFFPHRPQRARERYFVSRLTSDASDLEGTADLLAARALEGLRVWTSCDRREVFVGVGFEIERRSPAGVAAKLCLSSGSSGALSLSPRYLPCGGGGGTPDPYEISLSTDFSTCPEIGQGWGYHAFCWKARHRSVSYSAPSSGMPTGTVSGADANTLNSFEASTSVWPDGNPPGSWFGRSSRSAAELAVGAAISIHRWDAPSYGNLAGPGRRIGIKRVVLDVLDAIVSSMTDLCDAQGWNDNSKREDDTARGCINDHGGEFVLDTVTYDWWDSSFHADEEDDALKFGDYYTQFEPWVSDPPDDDEGELVLEAARRLRGRIFVRVTPKDLVETIVLEGVPRPPIAPRSDGVGLLVRLDDLGG